MQGAGKVRAGLCGEWQEAGGTGHMGKRKVKSRAWKERSPGMGFQTNGALADAELKKAIQTSRGRTGSCAIGGPQGYLRSAPSRSTMKRQSPSSSPLGGFDLDGLLRPLVTARPWPWPFPCPAHVAAFSACTFVVPLSSPPPSLLPAQSRPSSPSNHCCNGTLKRHIIPSHWFYPEQGPGSLRGP
jgi:hypothetical protein